MDQEGCFKEDRERRMFLATFLSSDSKRSQRAIPPPRDIAAVELHDFAHNSDNQVQDMPVESQEDTLLSFNNPQDRRKRSLKLGVSFFLFGLFNEILYVIIISAALDLVPPSTPKGIILFCSIFPAFVAKFGWSYLVKGKIQYSRRIIRCTLLSFTGMLVVALFESLSARLLGISLASFSSGLGELTYLQLSVTYNLSLGGRSVGHFASGSGTAGLVGAFLWWEIRGLGVQFGVGVSSILPFVLPLTYFFLLPHPAAFMDSPSLSYTPLPEEDPDIAAAEVAGAGTLLGWPPKVPVFLTAEDKWRLVKPMILKYMLPIFSVYTFEYTINQGVAPTLLYPVPRNGLLSKIIHSVRDYYPLWQLVYQSTVFISRSSITLGLPPLPEKLLSLPAVVQLLILITLMYESAIGIFSEDRPATSIVFVFLLISVEGICGGLAYVNMFYWVNQERPDPSAVTDAERAKQELEFKMGSLGLSNLSGNLLASLLAIPTEVELCRAQVARTKTLCQGL